MKKLIKKTAATVASCSLVASAGFLMTQTASAAADPELEERIMQMERELRMLRQELARVRSEAQRPSEKVMELEEWRAKVEAEGPREKTDMVFFRGGYARNDTDRFGDILTDANADNSGGAAVNIAGLGVNTSDLTGNPKNGGQDGWYFGVGLDHHLSENLFGLMNNTDVLAEIMFEYKEFDSEDLRRAPLATAANDSASGGAGVGSIGGVVCNGGPVTPNGAGPYGSCSNSVTVTQFTLTASPKIKFMKGSSLRPWIIPAGFAYHVISPPSDGVTVNAAGIMFAAGADYKIWKDFYVGLDARYHLVNDALDGVNIDGLTAGGYLGIGF